MKKTLLGNVCTIKSSKRIYQNEYVDEGIPFYRGKEISELSRGENPKVELYISRQRYNELELKFGSPKKGDLFITSVGTIGNTWVSDGRQFYYKDGNITQIIRNDAINTKYLSYLFKSDILKKQYSEGSIGTAQIALTIEKLNKLVIPITNLELQNKIVEILDKSQSLIDKRKAQIEALDELVKSRFIEMFGDPINNPKGWEVKKLKDISTKILSGNTPKGGSEVYGDEGIMFFRSQNVWKNRLVLDDIAYIHKETHNKMSKSSLKNRDILMTKTGRINTENSSLGRAAMFIGDVW